MFRYTGKDLNEFKMLCESLAEDDAGPVAPDDRGGENFLADLGIDGDGPEEAPNEYAYLDRVKSVIKSYQKVGNNLEGLIRDPDTPDDLKNYLVELDKQISQIYMRLYQFGHKVKEKSYGIGPKGEA